MENDEIARLLTGIQRDIGDLRSRLERWPNAAPTGPASGAPVATSQEPTASNADEDGGIGELLSSMSSSGGLEMLASLMGNKKISSLAPLIGMFLGGGGGDESNLINALGEMSPEMQRTAKKLQGILPMMKMMARQQRRAGSRRRAQNGTMNGTVTSVLPANHQAGRTRQQAVIRSLQNQPEALPQSWGAWSINSWPRS